MKTMRICVFFCVLAVMAPVFARAQESGQASPKETNRQRRVESAARELYDKVHLTEEQKKKLKESKDRLSQSMKDMYVESRTLKDSLNRLLMKPDLDMNKINSIQSRLKEIQSGIIDARLNSILEVRNILTPEQFSGLIEFTHKRGRGPSKEKGKL
ncbi:MAG: Spy/CpxP family protein refolding chaperone [Candidatus Omnitrophica bacterium]|nr:Spy/CpxP family protein refolding chaperone [Candidatus Omnitrophota bacterium]